jgi:DNA-binding NarL/FixJ family response regulator
MQILIADDHPLFRVALRETLRVLLNDALIAEVATLPAAMDFLQSTSTDLVLLDLHMPGSAGLAGLSALRGSHPSVAVVIVSALADAQIMRRAITFGASAFIPKSAPPEQIQAALEAVLNCREWLPPDIARVEHDNNADRELARRLASLTPQQFRVLQAVAAGRLNKQIASDLHIVERTVKAHLGVIFEKLKVRNRTQASVLFQSLTG